MRLTLLAFSLLWLGCSSTTSVRLSISGAGDGTPAPLTLSVFDAHHALLDGYSLGDKALPLVAVAYAFPATAEPLRIVVTRAGSPRQLGAQKLTLAPHGQSRVAVVVSASTPDSDGDGVPDSVDNCPRDANPDQSSASGLEGNACSGSDGGGDGGTRDLSLADLGSSDLKGSDGGGGGAGDDMAHVPTLSVLAGTLGGAGDADGVGPLARLNEPYGVAVVGTSAYVSQDEGRLRKIDLATGTVTTVALVDATSGQPIEELSDPTGLAYDGSGNLYVAESGGAQIRRVQLSNGAATVIAGNGTPGFLDGSGANAEFNTPIGLAFDTGGKLWVADLTNHAIRIITLGASVSVATAAGQPGASSAVDGSGGATGTARFFTPYTLVVRGTKVFVGDGSALRQIDTTLAQTSTSYVTTVVMSDIIGGISGVAVGPGATDLIVAGNDYVLRDVTPGAPPTFPIVAGSGMGGAMDGTGTSAILGSLGHINGDGSGSWYFTDGDTLRRFQYSSRAVTTIAGVAEHYGSTEGAPSTLYRPNQLAFDGSDTIYFADHDSNRIRAYTLSTGMTRLIAGQDTDGTLDGTGAGAELAGPTGLTLDGSGNLWVSEQDSNAIRKITLPGAVVSTVVAAAAAGPPPKFYQPYNLAFDGNRTIFVADIGNNVVRAIDTMTSAVSVFAGDGTEQEKDGVAAAAEFNNPIGLLVDRAHQILYVSDLSGCTVRAIDLSVATHPVTTLVGTPNESGATNGAFATAQFNDPHDMVLDAAANVLYLSDAGNNEVRRLDLTAKTVSAYVGDGTQVTIPGALPAKINTPGGLALTPRGLVVGTVMEDALLLAH